MAQITIDTNDEPKVLRACRNMLSELIEGATERGAASTVTVTGANNADLNGEYVKTGPNTSSTACDDQLAPDPDADETANSGDTPPSIFDKPVEGGKVDQHGVTYNPQFCANAAQPFYGSGKNKGQWKRRKGVVEGEYDGWYAAQLDAAPGTLDTTEEEKPVNTAGAFGGQQAAAQTSEPAPTDCGSFMGWVSAKQAAELLTQDDIGTAYTQAGIQVTDLFPPNDAATVQGHVTSLFNVLAPIAASRGA